MKDIITARMNSFADESGKEYKDVRENVRSVGFGKNPKGDRSFLCFILLWGIQIC